MRQELTRLGVRELKTADEVDTLLRGERGTVMVVVNSMCGCAAGKARPGIAQALQHTVKPDVVATVFAGGDIEATERARGYFTGYPPSSPSVAILRDGKLVYMMERRRDRESVRRGDCVEPGRGLRSVLHRRQPGLSPLPLCAVRPHAAA